MAIRILPHGVPTDATTHLSPLQTQLLHSPKKVRIASAPTGAGKSYAFQRAMIDYQERILFIVPTRRLAQNLAFSLKNRPWGNSNKVTVWSSDKREELEKAGSVQSGKIRRWRIREIFALDDTREGGEIIFAIPEVVSDILLRDEYLDKGLSEVGIFDFLGQFDHIVFDEFHTIDPRGFGLAAVFAKLAVDLQNRGRAKVSFLSATPLAIQPILEKLGISAEHLDILEEVVSSAGQPGMRTIHGAVQLSFAESSSLAEVLADHEETIKREVAANYLVVAIYNRLGDLERQVGELAKTCDRLGILQSQRLLVNSVADRAEMNKELVEILERNFTVGRHHNPNQFKVLVATSSVEIGVTFNTRLLFMEPGFEPLNFLQRYGRAARGDLEGQVVVRWDEALAEKMPWLRKLLKWARQQEGKSLEIHELSNQLKRSVVELFEFKTELFEEEPDSFGPFPKQAIYTAGLYWLLLQRQSSNNRYARRRLFKNIPDSGKALRIWLKQVRTMVNDKVFGETAQQWCDRFKKEVRILRNIERRIMVVDKDGHRWPYPESYLERETDILERGLLVVGERGTLEVHIHGALASYYRDKRLYKPLKIKCCFPHRCFEVLEDNSELVNKWCKFLREENDVWRIYPEAMEAAEKLVRATGLVVGERDDIALATSTGVC